MVGGAFRSAWLAALVSLGSAACALQARAATDAEGLLQQAADARTTVASANSGGKFSAVYLDTAGPCTYVALVQGEGTIENFSICGGALGKRNVSPQPWPDTPATREFRERVVYLALLYRSSSGIDPNGYKIRARLTDARSDTCKIAEVSTMVDHALVRLDLLPACPH